MTGTVPYDNGIVGEHWMDRKTLRPMYCVDDATCEGWLTSEKYSPVALNVSTVTDELKMATGGRGFGVQHCPGCDAAILAAGHAADGAFWIDNASGQWSSTSYYGQYPDWALRYDVSDRLSGRIFRTVLDSNQSDCREFQFLLFRLKRAKGLHISLRETVRFMSSRPVRMSMTRSTVSPNIVWIIPSWAKTL